MMRGAVVSRNRDRHSLIPPSPGTFPDYDVVWYGGAGAWSVWSLAIHLKSSREGTGWPLAVFSPVSDGNSSR